MGDSRIGRRGLLRAAGGVAVGLPFLSRYAAAAETLPKRMIVIFSPNGFAPDAWTASTSGESFTLGPGLQALAPHKQDLILLRGMEMLDEIGSNSHTVGIGQLGTGWDHFYTDRTALHPKGPSVDHVLAARLKPPTPFKNFQFGVRGGGGHGGFISFSAANQPVPPENDPARAFTRLFGGVDPTLGQRLRARRQSVLDLVHRDLTDIRQGLGAADRARLDAHQSAVRDIEQRLLAASSGTCSPPTQGPAVDPTTNDNYPTVTRLQMDLLARAFACDLTRYVTFQWEVNAGGPYYRWLNGQAPGIGDRDHHSVAHEGNAVEWRTIDNWHASQVAYLISALKAIPEGDGTVFDNTVIVWGTELPRPDHSGGDMAFILAGSLGGTLRTGRLLNKSQGGGYIPPEQRSNYLNPLMLALIQRMGVTDTTFGNPYFCQTGPMGGLS